MNTTRIQADYQALVAICEQLDSDYYDSADTNIGHKVGHYDDDRMEIQFYGIEESRLTALRDSLDKAAIYDQNGRLDKYELLQRHVIGTTWLVVIRPRLTN